MLWTYVILSVGPHHRIALSFPSDRGTIWGTVTFNGKAAHGSMPGLGNNALHHACSFIHLAVSTITPKLENLSDDRVIPPEARAPSLAFTVLRAGENVNSVPDAAVVCFDRRIVPSETLTEARQQILDVLEGMKKTPEFADLEYEYKEDYVTEATWVDPDQLISRVFRDAIKVVTGQEAGIVVSPGTDDQVSHSVTRVHWYSCSWASRSRNAFAAIPCAQPRPTYKCHYRLWSGLYFRSPYHRRKHRYREGAPCWNGGHGSRFRLLPRRGTGLGNGMTRCVSLEMHF